MKNGPPNSRAGLRGDNLTIVRLVCCITLLLLSSACSRNFEDSRAPNDSNNNTSGTPALTIDAAPIIERYRALDNSRDSTTRLRASISGAAESDSRQILFNMYRKRTSDGRLLILIEFTSPPEERDRNGLITVFPDGQVEGVRYMQSTDSYIVTRDLMGEDALFGMTLQELADGQPEKYDFTIAGEEVIAGTECYRAEGRLRQGAESKFPRVVLLLSKQSHAAVDAKFFDNRNEIARDLVVNKTELVDGYLTRLRWTMDNLARRKKIDFEVVHVGYDKNLKDSVFTRDYLKKISSR